MEKHVEKYLIILRKYLIPACREECEGLWVVAEEVWCGGGAEVGGVELEAANHPALAVRADHVGADRGRQVAAVMINRISSSSSLFTM